jgi:hypothetical protein
MITEVAFEVVHCKTTGAPGYGEKPGSQTGVQAADELAENDRI